MQKIYLDNASTTQLDEEVLYSMLPFLKEKYGNASSLHSLGKTAKVLLEDARDTVAEFIGADSKEIFFTNSGTESNNFAIKGIAYKFLDSKKKHIISSSIEHSAVLDTLNFLVSKFNYDVKYIKPDNKGEISPEDIASNITPETLLISIMHSNNEIGYINNIKAISEIALKNNIFLHTDSVQSIGKISFNIKDLNVNFATLSAHKIYGPKGIAALYVKNNTPIEKLIHGGKQERDMRGGTENVAAIAGFKKAIDLLKINFEKDIEHYNNLKSYLIEKLKENYQDRIVFNSSENNSLPNIVNFTFDPANMIFDEDMMLIQLDLKGIALSGGSACTSGTHQPSHVLTELGRDRKSALGSLRVSFSRQNTIEEIDYFLDCLKGIVKEKSSIWSLSILKTFFPAHLLLSYVF